MIERRNCEALASAEAAAAADPTRATAWLIIGDAMHVRNPKRAIAAFRANLAIPRAARGDVYRAAYDPDFDPERLVRTQLGLALLRLDRRGEAIVELERALEDIPPRDRHRLRANVQISVARGLCLAYALRDDVAHGLLVCEQLDATDRAIADGTLPYSLARLFLVAGDHKRGAVAATAFAATRRGLVIPPATLADPAALADWLRTQKPPIPR
jgi:tetratricopeptide (TPR) repeat protein